jgi:hypothetical protein
MLYMIYATIRKLKAPRTFKQEFLLKKPYLVMGVFWLIGLVTWITITFCFDVKEFHITPDYQPIYLQTIFNFFSWFLIDVFILILTLYMVWLTFIHNCRNRQNNEIPSSNDLTIESKKRSFFFCRCSLNSKSYSLDQSEEKSRIELSFFIIMVTFLVQWFIPCFMILVDPICSCIAYDVEHVLYWFTYTVCFTGM